MRYGTRVQKNSKSAGLLGPVDDVPRRNPVLPSYSGSTPNAGMPLVRKAD